MIEESLWRLGIALFVVCFTFIVVFFVSIFIYKVTDGRIYQIFVKQPKRFIFISFAISLVFACGGVIVDLFNLLLAPIMINPVNTNNVIVLGTIQFLFILILGGLLAWLSFKLGIPSAYKLFHRH